MTSGIEPTRPAPAAPRPDRQALWFLALLALMVLVVVAVRVRLLQMPFERDEGEFAYEGQLMLDGVAPYQLVYHMKLPGTYAAYGLMMAAFGQSVAAIHAGFLLTNLATIALVFLVARKLMDSRGAATAAASYALLSASPTVVGLAAHATHLVVLGAMAGTWVLLRAREKAALARYFWSGVLFGISFLCKQPGLFFGVFAGAVILRDETQKRPIAWGKCLAKIAVYTVGAALPFLLACLAIWRAGTFKRFWFWTFDYAKVQTSLAPAETARYQLHLFLTRSGIMPWAWALAAVGLLCLFVQRQQGDRRFILVTLLGCSLLAFTTRLYFTGHYFIVMLPIVSLLIGIAVSAAVAALEKSQASLRALPQIAFALGCVFFIYYNRAIWFELSPNEACRQIYGANPFPESVELAKYIREHSEPGARIQVMGSEPQIYFYAHRHSSTGFVNMYDLTQTHPYASDMQNKMIQEVEAVKPEYFLYVEAPTSWLVWPGADRHILDWSRDYTQKFYELVGMTYINRDRTDYVWGKEAAEKKMTAAAMIYVFKRKV